MPVSELDPELLARLHQISIRLMSSLDLTEVCSRSVDEAVTATRSDCGALLFRDGDGDFVPESVFNIARASLNRSESPDTYRLIERVGTSGQPAIANNLAGGPALCIVLRAAWTALGVLYVSRPTVGEPFSTTDLDVLGAIGDLAGLAIQNARSYQDAARGAVELRRLYDTSLDITSQLDIDKLLALIIQRAADLLHANSGNFYFYDEHSGELVPTAPYGEHVRAPVSRIKPGEGATGRVYQSGQALVIQNYDEWEGRLPGIPIGRYARVLHVPLKRGQQVLGVMSVNRARSAPPFSQDDVRLLLLFASQASIAIENARLYAVAVEQARVERELQVARQVQVSLLPRSLPAVEGWEFGMHWQPARQVSGDLYDFITLADGRLGFIIGDVAGKGVPAALTMATARAHLRGAIRQLDSPGAVLARVNELLQPDIPPKTFVTVLYSILDPRTGRLVLANAGHDLPYHKRGGRVTQVRATGVPLGLMSGMRYEETVTELACGDTLVFYSDGLVEAHNLQREMFGFSRLAELIAQASCASELTRTLLAEFTAFTGPNAEQEDDLTLVTLTRLG